MSEIYYPATFRLGSQREVMGNVVKINNKTIWVRLEDKKVIKRHMRKHNVRFR